MIKNITRKIQSRKFFVFFVWLGLVIFSFLSTQVASSTQELILLFFGRVSLIYIGGNVVQKFIEGYKCSEK